jgi:amidase
MVSPSSDPSSEFASALAVDNLIRERSASSLELTERALARLARCQPVLNAFTYVLYEQARASARLADEALARGELRGPFHGVPFHVKESFGVAGQPCTWGWPAQREARAREDAEVVARLRAAGGVLLGGTNVARNLMDWQTANPVYGTTNNPWDHGKTPGGSSGGSAAALAAGIGYLSVGSDLAGSIRVPAHFCGVYGHKPTLDVVSSLGQQPGGTRGAPGFSSFLAVAGPMARSADDLLTALRVLGGPVAWEAKAWRWQLPEARAQRLGDFRVGFVLDDPLAPVTAEVSAVLESVIGELGSAGVQLVPGWPEGCRLDAMLETYGFLLNAFTFSLLPASEQRAQRAELAGKSSAYARAALSSFADWQQQNIKRVLYRARWQKHFEAVDVFLCPTTFCNAFAHDHGEPVRQRRIATSTGERAYGDLLKWIAPATLAGLPATTAPVGLAKDGLPVGLQIIGPYGEDATPLTFATLLAKERGGFRAPGI